MTTLPGFIALVRDQRRNTRSVVPGTQAIAQLIRAALSALIESRGRRADREIARVLRVRIADLPRLSHQPCKSTACALNLVAVRCV